MNRLSKWAGIILVLFATGVWVIIIRDEIRCMRLQQQRPDIAYECGGSLPMLLLVGSVALGLLGVGLLYNLRERL